MHMADQLSLFQDEYLLLNHGIAALATLDLDAAVSALETYRDLYHDKGKVERMLAVAVALGQGLALCPENCPERPARLYSFWNDFEAKWRAGDSGASDLLSRVRLSFFMLLAKAVEDAGLPDSVCLAPRVPVGYVHLQTGNLDRAIRSLQTAIAASPDNAAVYGYLGDAYFLRGEPETARQIYLEACLIDPEGMDWSHLKDATLTDIKVQLEEEHGFNGPLACHWLPGYAYVRGVFRPKQIRRLDEFGVFVDAYLALAETARCNHSPVMDARLFLRGIVLCDNEPFLTMVRGIDFPDVRRRMKEANPSLFAVYLRQIERRQRLN